MKAGAAEVDITPRVGVELCGYAARVQPSVGVMDRLFAKAIYVEAGAGRLLWVVLDLIAVDRELVMRFRAWALVEFRLASSQVMVSATHTHSGPATIRLNAAGRMDPDYVDGLFPALQRAARAAVDRAEACEVVTSEVPLDLAVDRRGTGRTDSRATGIGFRRADGTYVAAVVRYAMHPVALGHVNREIGRDWCGYTADGVTEMLPGNPITLVVNGAAGNLNPPGEGWAIERVRELGRNVATAVVRGLGLRAKSGTSLRTGSTVVPVGMEVWTRVEMERIADREIAKVGEGHPWYRPIREAIEAWKVAAKAEVVEIELHVVWLGGVVLVGVNCEMFVHFADDLRERLGPGVYVVGYTNGAFGYVPDEAAYQAGGYEVDSAHLFYNSFRPTRGSLEMLCDRATEFVRSLSCGL